MKNALTESSRLKIVTNVFVFCLSLYGVSRHSYRVNDISMFEKYLIEIMAPLQAGTMGMKERVSSVFRHYIAIVNTSKKNDELVKEVDFLKNEVFQLQEVKKENQRLKMLLEFGEEIPRKKVLAQVIGWDSSNEFKVLRINKGRADGLKLLSPVITMNGLVGYLYRVAYNHADILTILDQNNRVDAIVSRTRTHGIVEGRAGSKCRLKHVARTDAIKEGDVVLTAGLGNIYPKGIKVGKVSEIDKENWGITQAVEISPSVDFHRLEEVLVLTEMQSTIINDPEKERVDEI